MIKNQPELSGEALPVLNVFRFKWNRQSMFICGNTKGL